MLSFGGATAPPLHRAPRHEPSCFCSVGRSPGCVYSRRWPATAKKWARRYKFCAILIWETAAKACLVANIDTAIQRFLPASRQPPGRPRKSAFIIFRSRSAAYRRMRVPRHGRQACFLPPMALISFTLQRNRIGFVFCSAHLFLDRWRPGRKAHGDL